MQNLLNKLLISCIVLSCFCLNANAGLIQTPLLTGYETVEEDESFSVDFRNNIFSIQSYYQIADDSFAELYWLIDLAGLDSLSFNSRLFTDTEKNYTFAKVMLGEQVLWSQNELFGLQRVTLDLSNLNFASSQSKVAKLRFIHQSQNIAGNTVFRGNDRPVLSLSNIQLSRIDVPEPSSIVLFLFALIFVGRKRLTFMPKHFTQVRLCRS